MLSFQYPDVYRDETSVSTPLATHRASGPAPPAARLPQPRVPAPRTGFPAFVCRAGWGRGAPPSAGPGGWPRPTCPSEPVVSVARPLGQTGRHGRLVLLGTQNVPLCLKEGKPSGLNMVVGESGCWCARLGNDVRF